MKKIVLLALLIFSSLTLLSAPFDEFQSVMDSKCMSCHGPNSSRNNFPADLDGWKNSPFIEVGMPSSSQVYNKLKNVGGNMPIGSSELSAQQLEAISNFIVSLESVATGGEANPPLKDSFGNAVVDMSNKNIAIYTKCHKKFVRRTVKSDDPILAKIVSAEITGTQACYDLLASVDIETQSNYSSKQAEIIETFNDLHQNWFPRKNLEAAVIFTHFDAVFDVTSPSLYFTHNMFSTDNFSQIFKESKFPYATRRVDASKPDSISINRDTAALSINFLGVNKTERPQRGRLLGINMREPASISIQTAGSGLSGAERDMSIHKKTGGGIINDASYIMTSSGDYIRKRSNGGLNTNRTLTQNIFKDFFCRDLPVVRASDSAPFAHPELASPLPYLNGYSCVGCHSSLDPMANLYRNHIIHHTRYGESGTKEAQVRTRFLSHFQVSLPSEDLSVWPTGADRDFHKRPPNGKLFFRKFDGAMDDIEMSSVADLGNYMSSSRDVFACVTSKYYRFMTGVKVNLDDLGNVAAPQLSSEELRHRNIVIKLADKFMNDPKQDIKKLLSNIAKEDSFLSLGSKE